jgi:hypothetical protein
LGLRTFFRNYIETIPRSAYEQARTTFEIIVEAMLGGSASLDADRYGRALTDNFDTIPWHLVYDLFSLPEWTPYPICDRRHTFVE